VAELLRIENITKRFGNTLANDRVSFSVEDGAIHGIVGENGAGKSTIMKIFYGMYPADSGTIYFHGNKVTIAAPQDAIALGVGMVHQHFMLVPTLTIWENVILGSEPKALRLSKETICESLNKIQNEFGFNLNLDSKIEDLSVGLQQQVEILKILYRNAKTLILDEPTAVLTPQEVDVLFTKLAQLNKQGKTIIVITHKLKEILKWTSQVTVMRQGKVVETADTKNLTSEILAEKIIGRKQKPLPKANQSSNDEKPCLEFKKVSLKNKLNQLSFKVFPGEIVGIAGIDGNGQNEIVDLLAKISKCDGGEISAQKSIAIIPPDRHTQAVVLEFSVSENAIFGLQRLKQFGENILLSKQKVTDFTNKLIEEFDIRPRETEVAFSSLSGGNQQKLVVGRETEKKAPCLVACHPTRGVDIGAIEFIHSHLIDLKNKGVGILLFSSELEEILALSDRVLVIYQGEIVGEKAASQTNEKELGLWMTGGKNATA